MMPRKVAFLAWLLTAGAALCSVVERLDNATVLLREVMDSKDHSIPQSLLDKAECAVLIPGVKKGAFLFGATYGRGFITCRKAGSPGWIGPAAVRLEGGSFGLQIGGSETDVILLVMNKRGAQTLLKNQFKLGGDASVAAGPVGRTTTAATDVYMRAEMLSWSRSRGVFAGISLEGSTLRQELSTNQELYGRELENKDIFQQQLAPPQAAKELVSLLNKYSSRKGR